MHALRSRVETLEISLQAQEKAHTYKLSSSAAQLAEAQRETDRIAREAGVREQAAGRDKAALQASAAQLERSLADVQDELHAVLREKMTLTLSLEKAWQRGEGDNRGGLELASVRQSAQQFETQLVQNQKLLKVRVGQGQGQGLGLGLNWLG